MAELPKYLDDFIFEELGGVFQPGQNVDVNLRNDETANKRYIGTYFPRSLIECYFIFQDLYAHGKIKGTIDNKTELKILDIGTGTGGNIIGLMHFLKNIKFNNPVEFLTIEGNKNAIDYQIKFFNKFNQQFKTNYKLKYANITFQTNTLNSQLTELLNKLNTKYDIITSFKFISEFYNSDYQNATGLFKSFSQTLSNYLAEKGLFLLLDLVSGDYEHRNTRPFTTQIMSDELNQFVQMPNSQLSYILPICCGFWSDGCRTQQCYIERQFEIKHSRRTRDITKVTYRVMVKKIFAREILENVQAKEHYQMSYNSWHPRYCRNTSVIEKTNETELPNAFKLI